MKNRILVPRNINLEKLVKNHPPEEVHGFKIDKAYFVIYQIVCRQQKEDVDNNGYTCLHTNIMRQWVNNFWEYTSYLMRIGVVESDGVFIPGSKSKGYRIADEYQSKGRFYKITDWPLIKAWNNKPNSYYEFEQNSVQYYRTNTAPSEFSVPTITERGKSNSICVNLDSGISIETDDDVYEFLEVEYNSFSNSDCRKFNYRAIILDKMQIVDWTARISPKCCRLSYWFTQTPRNVRPYLRIDGEYLAEVDLKNSHPFFSLLLFEVDFFTGENLTLTKIAQNYKGFILSSSLFSSFIFSSSSIKLLEVVETSDNRDVDLYRFLVLSGKLYKWLSNRIYERFGERLTGRPLKDKFFQAIYSSPRFQHQKDAKYKRLLQEFFPTVMQVFRLIQVSGKKTLPHLLLLIEAHFFVFEFQFGQCPYPVLDLHDCIVTTRSNVTAVQKMIQQTIMEQTGLIPITKIKYYDK